MVLQPTDLDFGSDSVGAFPKRIHPAAHGGCISRKFASVATEIELPVGTPVAWNDALEQYVAWDPNTGVSGSADEVVTITVTGTPTGGTFTLTFDGQTTAPIAFNASAATVLAAVIALSNVPAGGFTASGGALPGTPVVLTAAGELDDSDLPEFFANGAGLTGGTTPTVAAVSGTEGAEGTAPASEIVGFIFPNPAILLTTGQTFHTVMSRGTIHRDDIVLPVTGGATESQLDEALRDGLLAKGIIVQHLTDAH